MFASWPLLGTRAYFFGLVGGYGVCGRCVTSLTDWLDVLLERTMRQYCTSHFSVSNVTRYTSVVKTRCKRKKKFALQKKNYRYLSYINHTMSSSSRAERDNKLKKLRDAMRSKRKSKAVQVKRKRI